STKTGANTIEFFAEPIEGLSERLKVVVAFRQSGPALLYDVYQLRFVPHIDSGLFTFARQNSRGAYLGMNELKSSGGMPNKIELQALPLDSAGQESHAVLKCNPDEW
ncbi:MAG: hypothetical protein AAF202_07455, partial [Pseudomonadota bacterium]